MRYIKSIFFTILLLLVGVVSSFGQLKFHVASFGEDQFDLAARDERFKKIDGSGSLYAIIKVSGDDLKEYNFNFGNMNHLVESHEDQLWVYVQKNAKHVTITRSGYTPLRNYDLRTTIEAGKTYVMQLSAQGPVIYTQMVMFQTEPKVVGAMVTVQREGDGSTKELFGATGATGGVAKSLEFGTYTYEMMAENYHSTEGRFTLNNQSETHLEKVMLRSNGANITLSVASNADIYVNGEKRGTSSWTGLLRAGNYQVECRQRNHKSSSQTITVTEGEDQNIALTPPTPITGVLAVTSEPRGASIKIDGKDYGTTPRNITDLLIGQHTVTLSQSGYNDEQTTVEVKELQTTDISLTLKESNKTNPPLIEKQEYKDNITKAEATSFLNRAMKLRDAAKKALQTATAYKPADDAVVRNNCLEADNLIENALASGHIDQKKLFDAYFVKDEVNTFLLNQEYAKYQRKEDVDIVLFNDALTKACDGMNGVLRFGNPRDAIQAGVIKAEKVKLAKCQVYYALKVQIANQNGNKVAVIDYCKKYINFPKAYPAVANLCTDPSPSYPQMAYYICAFAYTLQDWNTLAEYIPLAKEYDDPDAKKFMDAVSTNAQLR
ncbi:MAG: PEGA domain-containing protein [Prevotella sp.]|nr:PEGA domain-containing protein [Prevotella sp.]